MLVVDMWEYRARRKIYLGACVFARKAGRTARLKMFQDCLAAVRSETACLRSIVSGR
jgi:hypothetical protein